MKILHLLSSSKYSGAENMVCQIKEMLEYDKKIEIIYCSPDGEIKNILNKKKIKFKPLKQMSIMEIRRVMKEIKPQIVHAHDMKASFLAALSCSEIPLVSHIHNNNFQSRKLSLKSLCYYYAAKKSKHIIWVSRTCYEGYIFHSKFKEKSSILYNIINYKSLKREVEKDKNQYDYDVVYLGRLCEEKDPQRLMRVLEKLVLKRPKTKIAIIGTGNLEKYVVEIIKNNEYLLNIDFLGFKSNPYKILSSAKVMIMTSKTEGTPMCVLEALSLGTPIVSTPVGGINDLIETNINGFLSNDDEELVSAIYDILENKDKYKLLSKNCCDKISKIMDVEEYKNKLLDIYRDILIQKRFNNF